MKFRNRLQEEHEKNNSNAAKSQQKRTQAREKFGMQKKTDQTLKGLNEKLRPLKV